MATLSLVGTKAACGYVDIATIGSYDGLELMSLGS
jgi:hypothetical protein